MTTLSAILAIGLLTGVPAEVAELVLPDQRGDRDSLAAHRGRPVERVAFARALYGTLEEVLDLHAEKGLNALRPRFDAFFRMPGRHVRVQQQGEPDCAGRVEGIDGDGALLLRTDEGVRRILAGDVTLAKPGAAP